MFSITYREKLIRNDSGQPGNERKQMSRGCAFVLGLPIEKRSNELDEQLLIQSVRQGDLDAFNHLVLRYQDLLFNLALGVLGDEDSAADATQAALLSAFRKFNEFRGGVLRSWLARVVLNACYDEIRRRRRRREDSLIWVSAEGEEIDRTSWLADPSPGPQERLERCELEQAIQECLRSLEPIYRTMLVLVDIEEMTYEQAACMTGVPLGTVKSRLARARMTMRQRLQKIPDLLPACYSFRVPLPEQAEVRYP